MAKRIRLYLKALQVKISKTDSLDNIKNREYIKWAYKKANDLDPLINISKK